MALNVSRDIGFIENSEKTIINIIFIQKAIMETVDFQGLKDNNCLQQRYQV